MCNMFYITLLSQLIFASICWSKKPNVLLVVVDDLRPALGVYNDDNAYTPSIDSLARESFVFVNAHAQQALCAPSRNSFLTSRRPDSLHLYDFYSYWRTSVANFTTLPQHFKENGYYTYSIGKIFHPGKSSNHTDDYPISWSDFPYHPITDIYKDSRVCLNRDGTRGKNLICPVLLMDQPKRTLPDIECLNKALNFLKNRNKSDENPYFLAVGFQKPHIPLKYPRKYLKYHELDEIVIPEYHFRPPSLPTVAWNPFTDFRLRDDIKKLNVSFPFGRVPENVTRSIIQSYSAAVTYVDELIGSLLNATDKDTIVVLMGDHGISLGEHGEFGKYSNYRIATRVPLIIRAPRLSKTMVVSKEPVELVDIFPTLVSLTDVSNELKTCQPEEKTILCTEGRSLVPAMVALKNNDTNKFDILKRKAIFTQYPRPGVYPSIRPNSDKPKLSEITIMGYSIHTDRYRFTDWVEFKNFTGNWCKVYATELYDHFIDPNENLNLAERERLKDVIDSLRNQLIAGWRHVK